MLKRYTAGEILLLRIPGLPPSTNHAYFNLPHGGRTLTSKGKAYKRETAALIAKEARRDLIRVKRNTPYLLHVAFGLVILNKTWPEEAENRYKRLDVGNHLKLVEDCFVEAAGIDDSQHLIVVVEKVHSDEEYTELCLYDLEQPGVHFALSTLPTPL